MKYKILNQTDNLIELFVLYEDNTFNGKVYESLIDGNSWSPSGYPASWKEIN